MDTIAVNKPTMKRAWLDAFIRAEFMFPSPIDVADHVIKFRKERPGNPTTLIVSYSAAVLKFTVPARNLSPGD